MNADEEAAFQEGREASRLEGLASLTNFNPYNPDTQFNLYDAYEEGLYAGPTVPLVFTPHTRPA